MSERTFHRLLIRSAALAAFAFSAPFLLLAALALDPKIDRNLNHITSTISRNVAFAPQVTGERVAVLIESNGNNDTLVSRLRAMGSKVHTTGGNILTAMVPIARIGEVAAIPEVTYVQGDQLVYPCLDLSGADCNVDDVQLGNDLPKAYDGKGVIVGVLDTGIDFRHEDFIDNDGKTKILYIWDVTDDGGPSPSEIEDSYGSEYTSDDINDEIDGSPTNMVRQMDTDGHGTHVAGIAASFGRAKGNYKGVAPGADIIFVKGGNGGFRTKDIVNGIEYMTKKANALGRPIVINLSLGGHVGAHDGTRLDEKKIDALSGQGKIFTVAAGNEGSDQIHCGYWTTSVEQDTQFRVLQSIDGGGADVSSAVIDIWYSAGSIEFKLQAFDKTNGLFISETPWFKNGDDLKAIAISDTTQTYGYVNAWAGVASQNNHNNVYLVLYQESGNSGIHSKKLYWKLKTKGSGKFDAWISGGLFLVHNPSQPTDGNNDSSVGMPGTCTRAITVANYTTRSKWVDIDGNNQTWEGMSVGNIAGSSSRGPSRNPSSTGQKPEIAAPGSMIIAPLSAGVSDPERKYIVSTNVHQVMNGTSMASPFCAGVIALLLQKNKDLTPEQVEKYLTQNARVDALTGNNLPNPVWGYGKIDALKAIKATAPGTPPITPPYGTLKFTADPEKLEAETGSTTTITSEVIHDANGNIVPDGTPFNVILYGGGEIQTPDEDGDYPGLQLKTKDGKIVITYKAPNVPEVVEIYVASSEGEADGRVSIPVQTRGSMGTGTTASGEGQLDRCFIANAAYGTPMAVEIRQLCTFRDQTLMTNLPGRLFVRTYYALSPPAARFIRGHEGLRAAVRTGLIPFVWGARLVNSGEGTWILWVTLFFMTGCIAAVDVRMRFRRVSSRKAGGTCGAGGQISVQREPGR